MNVTRRHALKLAAAAALVLASRGARALERERNGYYLTGSGIRKKKVAFVKVSVYRISHYMRELPARRSRALVIAMDVDKMFHWRMMRDVGVDKIKDALRDAYAMNGYTDRDKIARALSAFSKELKEEGTVSIAYDAASKRTTIDVTDDRRVSVDGIDFMQATWSIWLGNIDQSELGDQLISRIP